MNWTKVKKILILILIFINIILAIFIYYNRRNLYTLSSLETSNIKSILFKNGINVYDFFPQFYPMNRLTVKNSKINIEIIKKYFNNEEKLVLNTEGDTYTNKDGNEYIKIDTEGKMIYENNNGLFAPTRLSLYEVENSAEKFKDKFVSKQFDFVHALTKKIDDKHYDVIYNEQYQSKGVFINYLKVSVYEDGVRGAEMHRYEPVQFEGDKRYIYPPNEILLNFMRYVRKQIKEETIFITKLDIGYNISDRTNDFRITMIPYYRIILGNGQVFYINAYKNEIMQN